MNYRRIYFLLCIIAIPAMSKTYTQSQIDGLLSVASISTDNREFTRQFFTEKEPIVFIKNHLKSNKTKTEALIIEYKLNALLDEVSQKVKQTYLQDFILLMKNYKVNAYKLHQEGNLLMPVFDLNNRAKGIENIWQANDSLSYYTNQLNNNPITVLDGLKNKLETLSMPQWLGLKQSISSISTQSHLKISNYLMKSEQNRQGLDKFVSHYALLTANKTLVESSIGNLDKSNSEYLLRQLSNYFDDDFVVEQLINSVENKTNQKFAFSLLAEFVDKQQRVNDLLIDNLSNKSLASVSAFALSKSKDVATLKALENLFIKSQSKNTKKNIQLTLQLNHTVQAKSLLSKLANAGELK